MHRPVDVCFYFWETRGWGIKKSSEPCNSFAFLLLPNFCFLGVSSFKLCFVHSFVLGLDPESWGRVFRGERCRMTDRITLTIYCQSSPNDPRKTCPQDLKIFVWTVYCPDDDFKIFFKDLPYEMAWWNWILAYSNNCVSWLLSYSWCSNSKL